MRKRVEVVNTIPFKQAKAMIKRFSVHQLENCFNIQSNRNTLKVDDCTTTAKNDLICPVVDASSDYLNTEGKVQANDGIHYISRKVRDLT